MLCKFAWWSYPAPSTLSRHWFRLLRPHEVFPPLSPLRWTQNLAGQATCQDWRLPGTGPGGMGTIGSRLLCVCSCFVAPVAPVAPGPAACSGEAFVFLPSVVHHLPYARSMRHHICDWITRSGRPGNTKQRNALRWAPRRRLDGRPPNIQSQTNCASFQPG